MTSFEPPNIVTLFSKLGDVMKFAFIAALVLVGSFAQARKSNSIESHVIECALNEKGFSFSKCDGACDVSYLGIKGVDYQSRVMIVNNRVLMKIEDIETQKAVAQSSTPIIQNQLAQNFALVLVDKVILQCYINFK